MRTVTFSDGAGIVYFLILEDQPLVDLLMEPAAVQRLAELALGRLPLPAHFPRRHEVTT
ncbi:hypothetical protein C8D89_101882 [Actinomycetospora cinnamomea]|uniref:Uncharacterized protein n=1 Tax=Actinomycetospora cinnamomea TaxID=663609 RepID=A0A2U1FSC8_9PSEU|nr:hypothetical protein C8D89_101882 [Actinomycetospora cinnamomea]